LIWRLIGGEQRRDAGFVATLVADDAGAIADAVRAAFAAGPPKQHRSAAVELYRARLAAIDPAAPPTPETLRTLWGEESVS
jgi:malonate decarboxylase beta subunit